MTGLGIGSRYRGRPGPRVFVPTPFLVVESLGEDPVIMTSDTGEVSVSIQNGAFAGTYAARATDGAPLTAAMIQAAPTPLLRPAISGTAAPGQTLSATPALWMYDGAYPGDPEWIWHTDTDGPTGVTALTYDVTEADSGDTIRIEETFGGVTVSSVSTAPVQTTTAFDPASLFVGGRKGWWYDFDDTSTLFTDAGKTTAPVATGDSIVKVDDKSGNDQHLTYQNNTSLKFNADGYVEVLADPGNGTLRADASPSALFGANGLLNWTIFFGFRSSDANFTIISDSNNGFLLAVQDGSASPAISGADWLAGGGITFRKDGAPLSLATRDDAHSAFSTGADVVAEIDVPVLPNRVIGIMGYGAAATFGMIGRAYCCIAVQGATAQERADILSYIQGKF